MLQKLTREELQVILRAFADAVLACPEIKARELILYGSYARGDEMDGSDIDIMILSDVPREELPSLTNKLVDIACALEWRYQVVISPTIQNVDFFRQWERTLPFYHNISMEGIRYAAA